MIDLLKCDMCRVMWIVHIPPSEESDGGACVRAAPDPQRSQGPLDAGAAAVFPVRALTLVFVAVHSLQRLQSHWAAINTWNMLCFKRVSSCVRVCVVPVHGRLSFGWVLMGARALWLEALSNLT